MRTWNYRVMRHTSVEDGDVKEYYSINEVYSDGEGKPVACTENAVSVDECEDVETVRSTLQRMLWALDKPVLDFEDF